MLKIFFLFLISYDGQPNFLIQFMKFHQDLSEICDKNILMKHEIYFNKDSLVDLLEW